MSKFVPGVEFSVLPELVPQPSRSPERRRATTRAIHEDSSVQSRNKVGIRNHNAKG
ncbi:hypothetical protein RISK_004876 [Rhodopirellula islandica]|uniref:Uncharacterized protein n=1 Tax=Rhodopirellula islandica TaxID=595434 RepID=A0A0J1B8G3_RHOIS|nr:hypothetical protein RISK_004876 [Rhodopirellula islandica]